MHDAPPPYPGINPSYTPTASGFSLHPDQPIGISNPSYPNLPSNELAGLQPGPSAPSTSKKLLWNNLQP